ncbi:hypothetical protein BDV27DRAFT_86279 [Aspergillus caelatus]|uniref:Uncharacterized protein n=1 Tax=Aspergillus caelatus TaxID=61420 RepID=A0A5N6ZMQ4_9EURO|nr:uncharacterized protein BDV27DRAFT_86279 [Aspergillus caelatus]KAE8357450.1 hypothetical protein BDV27DRAFT_86279 [Aspergillus caelatus]
MGQMATSHITCLFVHSPLFSLLFIFLSVPRYLLVSFPVPNIFDCLAYISFILYFEKEKAPGLSKDFQLCPTALSVT